MDNKFEYDYFASFSHGLVSSKLWLCEELENVLDIDKKYHLHILGSWTNLVTFMLLTRKRTQYIRVDAYDTNESANQIAKSINDTWIFEAPHVHTHLANINDLDYDSHTNDSLYINCSVEHLDSRIWFDKIKKNTMVVIQSTNVNEASEPWFIKDPVSSVELLKERYPLNLVYSGVKTIDYGHLKYDRYMLIGTK